jgi:hypothetical protein
MHELNGVCLCWLNGAKWSKPACNPGLITLDKIARTSVALCANWTWPVWPSGAPVWPVPPSRVCWLDLIGLAGQQHRSDRCCLVSALLFALCTSCHAHHGFYFVAHTCCAPLILRYRGSSHAYSSKCVLLAFEANFLKFNSKHKLRGSFSYI